MAASALRLERARLGFAGEVSPENLARGVRHSAPSFPLKFSFAGLELCYNVIALREGVQALTLLAKQISRAGNGRARSPSAPPEVEHGARGR